ncbi:MAG TPA: hypothetical protein VFD03_09430 [Clostridia bacterium]|nr:hypothetical protein [Clostridia bacterium]
MVKSRRRRSSFKRGVTASASSSRVPYGFIVPGYGYLREYP